MKRQLVFLLPLGVCLVGEVSDLRAADTAEYCAFEVSVKSETGAPVRHATVLEREHAGSVIARNSTDDRGIARLCDAPTGLVDLEIGGELCGATSVKYLRAFWLQTRRVTVTYKNCSGEEWTPLGGCSLIIRVRDQGGNPLSGVVLKGGSDLPKPREQTDTSDSYGRIFRFMEYGNRISERIEKESYFTQNVNAHCKPGEGNEKEQLFTLQK